MSEISLLRERLLFIIESPSGAGKNAIFEKLLLLDDNLMKLPSFTTRAMRPGEREGYDYFFLSEAEFEEKLAASEILEYVPYYGNTYRGTLKNKVEEALSKLDKDLLFILSTEGVEALEKAYPGRVVKIFVTAPSLAELKRRLWGRDGRETDITERVEMGLDKVHNRTRYFDYLVINDDLDQCVREMQAIIEAERLKIKHILNEKEFMQANFSEDGESGSER